MVILYHEKLANDLSAIRKTRERLTQILKSFGYSDSQSHDYLLILTEYVSNLLRHTSREAHNLDISLRRKQNRLQFEIIDESPFYEAFAKRIFAESPVLLEADVRGMGINLITSLALSPEYLPTKNGCVFRFYTEIKSSHQETILVVDDDPVLLTLMDDYLAGKYNVIACSNVSDAMNKLADKRPALIISDIEMPECDGLTFRKNLAKDAELAQIPFIFLTGVEDTIIEQNAITQGIDDYLNKPVSKSKLRSGVQRILFRYQQMQQNLQAQDLQQFAMMNSRLPERSQGYQISFHQQAADHKSGDFVICQEYPNASYLFLGDVMGHGREAAYHGYTYAGYLRAFLTSATFDSPTEFMQLFSKAIAQDHLLQEQLLSLLVIKLSVQGIEIIAAGHEAPLLLALDGIKPIPASGPLPGFVPELDYVSHSLKLEPGQRLFAYTDGLNDALNEMLSNCALQSILAKLDLSQSDTVLLADLLDSIPERSQRPVNDDISCLLISQTQS